jgi:hypothetical protein
VAAEHGDRTSHCLVYQVIEELGRVLVLDLVTFREP